MQGEEALALLAAGLPEDQMRPQRRELSALAGRLGEWALLLKLVNGFLLDRVVKLGQPLPVAIVNVNERLKNKGFTIFDARNEAERTKAVARTIGVSLELLDESGRDRFAELGIFPEDVDIPIGIVGRLWAETGSLDEDATEDLLSKLYGLSLLLGLDLKQGTLRFHDTTRRFLRELAGKEGLVARHKRLLKAIGDVGKSDDADALTRRYFYLYRPHHLAEAGDRETLDAILLDPSWLKAKLAATGSPAALVADYDQHAVGATQNFIGRAIALSVPALARDPNHLASQLIGRLTRFDHPRIRAILTAAGSDHDGPWLCPRTASLIPPGPLLQTFEGTGEITALALLPGGRSALSASRRFEFTASQGTSEFLGTLTLLDLESGESRAFRGHTDLITAVAVFPDGRRALSASADGTLRLWELESGASLRVLKGHTEAVTAVMLLPDDRHALSGAFDKTLRLWDLEREDSESLEGHADPIIALGLSGDGRRAFSGSFDGTLRVWDLENKVSRPFEGHTGSVAVIAPLPKGRSVLSGCGWFSVAALNVIGNLIGDLPDSPRAISSALHMDTTLRLWNLDTWKSRALEGHTAAVTAVAVLPDGDCRHALSASADNTLRVWDLESGRSRVLEGHTRTVTAVAVLPDAGARFRVPRTVP
jgi:WD40 repeat protein